MWRISAGASLARSASPRAVLRPSWPPGCGSAAFFFFSSRRRHTSFDCDWSSDLCSSDLLSTEIVRGSGNRLLDTRAEAIARAAGPFGHFGPAMRAKADQIAVVSRFKFTREQTLQTTVQ